MRILKNFIIITMLICTVICTNVFADDILLISGKLPEENSTENVTVTETDNNEIQDNEIVFTDVPEDSPYAESIYKLTKHGVLNGYEDGSFKPEGEITRAEMTKMITLTFGITDFEDATGFPDVTENDWFYPYVLALQKQGAVNGYEDGSFRQANNVTREQICKIVVECAGLTALPIPNIAEISDKISTTWNAKEYVYIIVNSYLMPLEENNTFRATEPIKRYELANLLSKFIIEPVKPITANVRFFVGEQQYGTTDVVTIGDKVLPPEIAPVPQDPENYVFEGWKVKGTADSQIVEVALATVVEDVDYEAVFVKVHTVTFYNGSEVFDIQKVAHGHLATEPETTPEYGDGSWEFDGWYFTNVPVENSEVKINFWRYKIERNETFYARYSKVQTGVGGDTPAGPANPNSQELMDNLENGLAQFKALNLTKEAHIEVRNIIVDCVEKLLVDAGNGNLINKAYIRKYYGTTHIDLAEHKVKMMSGYDIEELSNIMTNGIDPKIRIFMEDEFDIKFTI